MQGRTPWDRGWRALRTALGGMALLALAGCASMRPALPPQEAPGPAIAPPSPRAAAVVPQTDPLVAFYADVERELTASGRMRLVTAPSDAPYSVEDLVRNFERIALYDEYVDVGGRFVRRETPALLRRWAQPVRVAAIFGPSVTEATAARDRLTIDAFTARIAALTGLDMRMTEGSEANFLVMILSSSERAAAAEAAALRFPGFAPEVLGAIGSTPSEAYCMAFAFAEPQRPSEYAAVVVLIRAEHPPLTRASCVQEEMAQAMGLPNDSPEARPSLFNDSLEFAFLTEHDAILLRMLYDPRLRPGMTLAEARPLLPQVARDAMAAQTAGAAAPLIN